MTPSIRHLSQTIRRNGN